MTARQDPTALTVSRSNPSSDRASRSTSSDKPVASTKSACRLSDALPIENFWDALLDSLPDGVIVVNRAMKVVHLNLKAKELCQRWITPSYGVAGLPSIVSETCYRFLRQSQVQAQPLIVEYPVRQGVTLRIRAQWLTLKAQPNAPVAANQLILLMLRDCDDVLREELLIEQQKYDLTEREAEIWSLLRQEKTYQEIAATLQISLNTVKTHVKNVYAKKRSFQGQEKVIVL